MDMESLMAQASELQARVAAAQDELARTSVKGIADGGACIVEMSGKYDLLNLILRPDIVQFGADKIAQVVMDAYRDAKTKADKKIDQVMANATAGTQIQI